ncbi:ribosomal protein S18 acetylase RimI-like enzyme [Scopulibacillus darangshiensis]|uniref:Ribosomal protein S18 acetylase RimI-like enzyme n=1 Tax=Scopulibacillus darangshiensis TaxID=442528 RepID=A0A4R2P4I6_9BACL|nr:GNAT family N-acetyltransferase [Scopulibacillus darangshiensis]TCP29068.1 ribosomal protein S18 acetylase RimI-like enzyme [Scopulibacillus darangshiensis]
MMTEPRIRRFNPEDEKEWLRLRVLSFLDTAYYDNVLKEKEKYDRPSIELVAEMNDQIVGMIDIEYESEEGTVCSRGKGLGGMIWHIAVHPDFQSKGIGKHLLYESEKIAKEIGLNRLEAWTRDDAWVNEWYEKNGFAKVDSYLHIFMDGEEELKGVLKSEIPKCRPIQAFAHYVGDDREWAKNKFKRVHECFCYVKDLI